MVCEGSLVSKLFAIKMIARSQIERETYMWTEKEMNAFKKRFIYLKMVLTEITNLGPTRTK